MLGIKMFYRSSFFDCIKCIHMIQLSIHLLSISPIEKIILYPYYTITGVVYRNH